MQKNGLAYSSQLHTVKTGQLFVGPGRGRRHHVDGQEPSGAALGRQVRLHFRRIRRRQV